MLLFICNSQCLYCLGGFIFTTSFFPVKRNQLTITSIYRTSSALWHIATALACPFCWPFPSFSIQTTDIFMGEKMTQDLSGKRRFLLFFELTFASMMRQDTGWAGSFAYFQSPPCITTDICNQLFSFQSIFNKHQIPFWAVDVGQLWSACLTWVRPWVNPLVSNQNNHSLVYLFP